MKNKPTQLKDSLGNVIGTIANRTRSDSDLGMVSAPAFHRAELKRLLTEGIDHDSEYITDEIREEVIREVLDETPEKIASIKHNDATERIKESMSREITDAMTRLDSKK